MGVYGIKVEDEEEGKNGKSHLPAPIDCPRCKDRNPEGASFCSKCGMALSFEAAMELDTRREGFDEALEKLLQIDGAVEGLLKGAKNKKEAWELLVKLRGEVP